MPKIIEITNQDQLTAALAQHPRLLIDFKAEWCGPCKMLHPILETLAGKRTDVAVAQVDVDKCPDIASQYKVMSIPALKLFDNGTLVKEVAGYMSQTDLEEWLK